MNVIVPKGPSSREHLLHALYEAAELEHNLMCTYLYAAYSLKDGVAEGLAPDEAEAVAGWRRTIIEVAIEEMGHLTAVWNITSALGGTPRFGRANFPLDIGYLPAGIVVKLAPFSETTLQHFIFLERPEGSDEPDGDGFIAERNFSRASPAPRLVPTAMDYDTVGEFYEAIAARLRAFVADIGEDAVFCGDPALQLSPAEMALKGIKPVRCLKTALAAFDAIVLEGEGAPEHSDTSHFQRFVGIRTDYPKFKAKNPSFAPAHPAATNPVLRRPPRPEGRVWIETPAAVATVDLANAAYGLTLRLLANSYAVPAPHPEKALSTDLATGLMRATTLLGEHAARLPAGPTHPECNAGISFTALRDSSPLPPGPAARRFFVERLADLARAAEALNVDGDRRTDAAARMSPHCPCAPREALPMRPWLRPWPPPQSPYRRLLRPHPRRQSPTAQRRQSPTASDDSRQRPSDDSRQRPATTVANGIEIAEGKALQLRFEAKRCIHARFCVTGAPDVFLANVKGPWIHPDAMDVERLGRHRQHMSVRRYPIYAQGRPPGRAGAAGQPRRHPRGRPLRLPRCVAAGRCSDRNARHALPLRRFEEQAVLRQLAPRRWLLRHRRAADDQESRHAARARRPARHRSVDRWAAFGARQSRDHERDRPRRRPCHLGQALPLRRQQLKAVLRWQPRPRRLQEHLNYASVSRARRGG